MIFFLCTFWPILGFFFSKNMDKKKFSTQPQSHMVWFILPSLVGAVLFMVPLPYHDQWRIPIGHIAKALLYLLGESTHYLMPVLLIVATLLTFLGKFFPQVATYVPCVQASLFWFLVRFFSGILGILVLFQLGPQCIWDKDTGNTMLYSLLPNLLINLIVSSLLSALLLEYGLLEFIGVLVEPLMYPIFRLPGRAAINCVTSWLGDGTMGTMIAMEEYEKRSYTRRETTLVITSFAAVSITFYNTILSTLNLSSYLAPFLLTTLVSTLIAAFILARIPPISYIPNTYLAGEKVIVTIDPNESQWQRALREARQKAALAPSFFMVLKKALHTIVEIIIGLLPGIMCIGTLSLIIACNTSFFSIIGIPFVWLLTFLGVPEAKEASEGVLIGFADMYMPVLLAEKINSPITRFIMGALSVTQIIYLSELGTLLLGGNKKFKMTLWELMIIFLLRTCITLPVIIACAFLFVR